MHRFDIIIIGGGPAGAMAGITLQKKGYNTCIIDKSTFPREKLCGGLLTVKTMELLREHCPTLNPDHFVVKQSNRVHFYLGQEKVTSYQMKNTCYLTERSLFDHVLIEEYIRNGGEVMENQRIKPADIDFDTRTIQTGSHTYGYSYLVGADGCNSLLLKKSGVKNSNFYCIEGELSPDSDQMEEMMIFFGVAENGYGWQFPKKGYDCVGIVEMNSDKNILQHAGLFFSQLDIEPTNQRGAPIPSGRQPDLSLLPDNTIVVGDAAGFVDPITGEGIYFALLSGLYGAEAIDAAISKQDISAAAHYTALVKPLRRNIAAALRLQKLLYRPIVLKKFMHHLRKRPAFGLYYLEKVIATNAYDYRNFIPAYFLKHRKRS